MPAPDARARAIVARLSEGNASSDEVFAAFEELDHLPPEIVRGALEPWTGPAPDPERLDDQVRRAHRLPLRTPRLTVLGSVRDADVLDLGELAEHQLRIAGKTWDGQDLDAWERLDGEREDSFAGTLERRVLGEGDRPLYDVVLFGEGDGVFFKAGTTIVLGVIADRRVETMDRPARAALERALAESAPAPAPTPPAATTPAATPPPAPAPAIPGAPAPAKQLALPMANVEPEARIAVEAQNDVEADEPPPAKKKKTASKKKAAAAAPAKAPAAPKKKKAAAATGAPKKKATAAPKAAAKKKTTKKKAAASSDDE